VNIFVPSAYDERIQRLALGLEPHDAAGAGRIARPVAVVLDREPVATPGRQLPSWWEPDGTEGRPQLARHGSGRFVLLYEPVVAGPVALRLVPRNRRYVPRRMSFDIHTEQAVLAAEHAGTDVPAVRRSWRPLLFPGATYDLAGSATTIRGRVVHHGAPVRWTRVVAALNGSVIGRAHGDDRGEFLLFLGVSDNVGDLPQELTVTIRVYGRVPALPVDPADPLADLEPEIAVAAGMFDPVSLGTQLPNHYGLLAERDDVLVPFARLTSVHTFVVP
jgi:hypothetical protein